MSVPDTTRIVSIGALVEPTTMPTEMDPDLSAEELENLNVRVTKLRSLLQIFVEHFDDPDQMMYLAKDLIEEVQAMNPQPADQYVDSVKEPQLVSHSVQSKLICEDELVNISVVDAEHITLVDAEDTSHADFVSMLQINRNKDDVVDLEMNSAVCELKDMGEFCTPPVRRNTSMDLMVLKPPRKPPDLNLICAPRGEVSVSSNLRFEMFNGFANARDSSGYLDISFYVLQQVSLVSEAEKFIYLLSAGKPPPLPPEFMLTVLSRLMLQKWLDRAGLEIPKAEARFQNQGVYMDVRTGSRASPTLIFESCEALNQQAVVVMIDQIQCVKSKVVINAFRLINLQTLFIGHKSYSEEVINPSRDWLNGGDMEVLRPIKNNDGLDHFKLSLQQLRNEIDKRRADAIFTFQLRKWAESKLTLELLKAVEQVGYNKPFLIKMANISFGLQQRDVTEIVERGFGKIVVAPAVKLKPDEISPQMVKYVNGVSSELHVDIEGVVHVPYVGIKGASQLVKVQVKVQVRNIYDVSRAMPNGPIQLSNSIIINKLCEEGHFKLIHLQFEMHMLAFDGCFDIITPEEQKILQTYRKENFAKKELIHSQRRAIGKCPLTPEEVGFVLRATGLDDLIRIYLAAVKLQVSGKWMRTHAGYQSHDQCLLFGSESVATLGSGNPSTEQRMASIDGNISLYKDQKKLSYGEAVIDCTHAALSLALEKKEKAEKLLNEVEVPQQTEPDKEGITKEELYMLRKVDLRMKVFLLMGRRGVFPGTVENMHLHWKYKELIKIISKEKSTQEESGGISVTMERVSEGHAIIMYSGKNFQRPDSLRPRTLLTKGEAMKRSKEAHRRKSLQLHVLTLTKLINNIKQQLVTNEALQEVLPRKEPVTKFLDKQLELNLDGMLEAVKLLREDIKTELLIYHTVNVLAFLICFVSKVWLFSLPRPPEVNDMRTRSILRGGECYGVTLVALGLG